MLFCRLPIKTETSHRTKAPVVPRAAIDPPSAASRNPGFAKAIMNPSHHDIAFRSSRSSTSAIARPLALPPGSTEAIGTLLAPLAACWRSGSTDVHRTDVGPADHERDE